MKRIVIFILLSTLSLVTFAQLPTLPVVSGSSYSSAAGTDGVHAIVRDASGNLYIGGDFTTVGSVSRKGIAKINADGTVSSWNPLNALSNVVIYTMTISGNKLFVGGGSTVTGGVFAAFDISGATPTTLTGAWNLSFNGQITELYAASNSRLYAAGGFTTVNNGSAVSRNNFATFDINATALSNVLITSGFLPTFDYLGYGSFEYDATNNVLYVGGEFTLVNSTAKSGVVGLNASTGALTSFNHTFTKNGANPFYINDIKIFNGSLYVAGSFINVDASATAIKNIASFTLSTGALRNWNINLTSSPTVQGISVMQFSGDNVFIGGSFTSINSTTRTNFAVVSETDASLKSIVKDVTNSNSNAVVEDLTAVVSNEIALAGTFTNGLDKTSTVTKIDQTITFGTLAAKTYGNTSFTLGATASSGLTVTYVSSNTSVATISGNTVTIVGAGSTTITASQAGDATYNAATSVDQSLTVNKAGLSITAEDKSRQYNVANPAFTLAYSGFVNGDDALDITSPTASTTATISSNVGDYTISLSGGSANNYTLTLNNGTLHITKADQTITFNPLADRTEGGADFTLTASSTSGLTVSFSSSDASVISISGTTATIGNDGSSVITASQAGNSNYNAATSVQRTQVVLDNGLKTNQTISFAGISNKTYGDAAFNLNATASSGLTVSYSSSNTSVATVSGNTVTIVGAGNVTITASQAGNATFNAAPSVDQSFTVNKADQTITFTATDKTLLTSTFNLNGTSSSNLTVTYVSSDNNVITIIGNVATIVGEGNVTITASQTGNSNYNAASDVDANINVTKASQTITFPALPTGKKIGDIVTLSATSTSGLAITYVSSDEDVAEVVGNTLVLKAGGTSTITASQAGNATYAVAVDEIQNIAVARLTATITFTLPAEGTVGEEIVMNATSNNANVEIVYTSSDESIAEIVGNTLVMKSIGTVTITASQEMDAFYNAASKTATIEVKDLITSVVDAERPTLSAYPNPTTDFINIQTASNKVKQITIFSMSGRAIEQLTATDDMVTINVQNYDGGVYIVKIADADNSATLKFVKK